MKSKPIVQLYERKTATGVTLYLHYTQNGKQVRESTGLRITGDSRQDRETRKAGQLLQAKKTNELLTERTGLSTDSLKNRILLTDFCEELTREYRTNGMKKSAESTDTLKLRLNEYKPKTRLCDVDKPFCRGFVDYLKTAKKAHGAGTIKDTHAKAIYLRFVAVLNVAVKRDIVPVNYATKVERPTARPVERVYLAENEVKAVAAVDCPIILQETKAAFLFSIYTGLRYSDIRQLTAANITQEHGKYRLSIKAKKTGKLASFALPLCAVDLISGRLENDGFLFELSNNGNENKKLRKLAELAGITKEMTFHTARHTFATLLLSKGGRIEVISDLLGHSDIKTTQIYAKIIDKDRDETAKLFDL